MKKVLFYLIPVFLLIFNSCANRGLSKQEKDDLKKTYEALKDELKDAEVTMDGDRVKVVLGEGLLFATGSDKINQSYKPNLVRMSQILNRYPKTNILISGHTDNTGTVEINESLSKRRADAARIFLEDNNVSSPRIFTWGLADRDPVANNATAEGKAKNRRVEFLIMYHYDEDRDALDK